jgi:hypothetical protein
MLGAGKAVPEATVAALGAALAEMAGAAMDEVILAAAAAAAAQQTA